MLDPNDCSYFVLILVDGFSFDKSSYEIGETAYLKIWNPFTSSVSVLMKWGNILSEKESNRFLKTVQNLKKLKSGQLNRLNIEVKKNKLKRNLRRGIF